jgi:hypothetical protein
MNTWLIVLTSSAVGVLVSGFVTLIGQSLERRARRDELILTESIQVARRLTENVIKVADAAQGLVNVVLVDEAVNAEKYFRWLKSLLDTGKLPPDADKARPK